MASLREKVEAELEQMDQALRDLYKQGLITYEMAQRRSHNPAELEKLIAGE